ncbi:hypothetical protein ACFYKX_15585 [Cytobacillus sp. FJAT-54145]|uniref:Uncharacterized protein n=1 Tax=Cytobacillus spartinae TaxID=3299023 RepID=A0ABW6KGP1_9BACI
MWQWILIILAPFIVLALVEETVQGSVHRYVNGPSKLELKMKVYAKKLITKSKETFTKIKRKKHKEKE